MFNCSVTHCQRICHNMIDLLSSCLKIAVPWPSKKEILKNLPICFEGFEDCRVVLDCTEIFIQYPQKLYCQVLIYSHYKQGQMCKIMTGVTPAGNISFISKVYGGKASDKAIIEQSDIIKLLKHGDAVMVHRGFLIDEICQLNKIKCIRPPLLRKKFQFSKSEAEETARIAKARVHVERSNQRIKIFDIVGGLMLVNLVPQLEKFFIIICATVNVSSPIIADNKFLGIE